MAAAPLPILGIGTWLPPTVDVREYVASLGGEVSPYRGWEHACHAGPDDHPSSMGGRALEEALAKSGVKADELRLVLYTGSSRDYIPSWSVASELMNICGTTDRCIGLDLTAGCLATLAALDLAQNWLAGHGGGCAAVVSAERWTQTINFMNATNAGLWQYGDSAGALVVGTSPNAKPLAQYLGAEFRGNAPMNGHVLIPYGGTREPQAPPGVNPNVRKVSGRPKEEITASYRKGYGDAYAGLKARFPVTPSRFVLNQMTPQIVAMLSEVLEMKDRTVVTGSRTGHLGGTDIIVGMQELEGKGLLGEPLVLGASTAYGFGTGFVVPVGWRE